MISKNQIRAMLKHRERFFQVVYTRGISPDNIIPDDVVDYIHEAMNIGKRNNNEDND